MSASAVAAASCRCSCIFSDDELAPSCEVPNISGVVLETGKLRRSMRAGLHPELVGQNIATWQPSLKGSGITLFCTYDFPHYPPPSCAQIIDILSRLDCPPYAKSGLARFPTSAFIDLSRFVSVEAAIDRGKECLTWIQSNMEPVPCKWAQLSSNLGCVHELQLDDKLNMRFDYLLGGNLGPYLSMHPLYRTEIAAKNCKIRTGMVSRLVFQGGSHRGCAVVAAVLCR